MVWGLLADGIRKVCACVWNAIPQARMNMDIVVIRLIMRTKVMQKMQKTKVFGKEKSSMLVHEREKPSWWCKGEQGLSVTVLDRNINKHLLRKNSKYHTIFIILAFHILAFACLFLSKNSSICVIRSSDMVHFVGWNESFCLVIWVILQAFLRHIVQFCNRVVFICDVEKRKRESQHATFPRAKIMIFECKCKSVVNLIYR